jgi:hypothetical protein
MESLERVFPLEVRGVVSQRFEVGNTAGEYTGCGSSPQGGPFTEGFFLHNNPPIHMIVAVNLTLGDIWHNGHLRSIDSINENFQAQLSLVSYLRLSAATRYWEKKLLVPVPGVTCMTVNEFIRKFKKGSKPFRTVLSNYKVGPAAKTGLKAAKSLLNVLTLPAVVGPVPVPVPVPVPARDDLQSLQPILRNKVLECWDFKFVTNRQREFLFKYTSNRLSFNNRLAHYNDRVNASCTLCVLEHRIPAPSESAVHLFFDCPSSESLHRSADRNFWPEFTLNDESRKKLWLCFMSSTTNHTGNYNTFVQMAVCTVQFFIWECKLKKHKPSWAACKEFTVENLKNMCQNNRFFNGERLKSNCSLSRSW